MDEILKESPADLRFMSHVVKAIEEDDYGVAFGLFLDGFRKLVGSNAGTNEELEKLSSMLGELIKKKLGDHSESNTADRFVIRCSFCLKSESQVAKLIAGGGGYICEGCIRLCNEILANPSDAQDTETGLK